jgi:hypothetical protein
MTTVRFLSFAFARGISNRCTTVLYTLVYLFFFISHASAIDLIKDTLFTKSSYWDEWYEETTDMDMRFGASGCTVLVIKPGQYEYEAAVDRRVTVSKEKTYQITLIASSDSSCVLPFGFKQNQPPYLRYAIRTVTLKPALDTIHLIWVNSGTNAIAPPDVSIGISLGNARGTLYFNKLSILELPVSTTDINDFECPVIPKLNPPIISPSVLPSGLLAYSFSGAGTIYLSPLNKWAPVGIPGIDASPSNISFSDDGKWLLYQVESKMYVIKIDGRYKTRIPTDDTLTACCFYRNSPYGLEIVYDLKRVELLKSIPVFFSDTGVSFGPERTIADLGQNFAFENFYQISVVKNQIWGAICPVVNGIILKRSGFMTIPDSGKGIATFENIYKFSDDNKEQVFGCSHTMSFDGQYCVANPGHAAETGDFSHCAPFQHKGFYVSRFYHYYDSAVTTREHVHRYSYSLNWCPDKYLPWEWTVVDFNLYNFTNNNKLLVAAQCGDSSSRQGLWAIDWESNSWYPLNPDSVEIKASGVAAHIGAYDSTIFDSLSKAAYTFIDTSIKNPIGYKILQPGGGEIFYPGEQCTIKVSSVEEGNAAIKLQFGKYLFNILSYAINPRKDSVIIYTIPQYFTRIKNENGTTETERITVNSSQCKIRLEHYTPGICDPILSEPFSIIPKSSIHSRGAPLNGTVTTVSKALQLQGITDIIKTKNLTYFSLYDLLGRPVLILDCTSGRQILLSILHSKHFSNTVYIARYSYTTNKQYR